MKRLQILLLLLPLFLVTAGWNVKKKKIRNSDIHSAKANGVLLVYTGNMSGFFNINIGYHVEMDSLIGLRCDIVFERGATVMSHTGVFYKFSSPDHTVFYNFLTHKSSVQSSSSGNNDNPGFVVIGTEKTGKYMMYSHSTQKKFVRSGLLDEQPGTRLSEINGHS